jgi:hypothetical protein
MSLTADSRAMRSDVATLWRESGASCVLFWVGDRYGVRLMRGPVVVKTERSKDERVLFDIANEWRDEWLDTPTSEQDVPAASRRR